MKMGLTYFSKSERDTAISMSNLDSAPFNYSETTDFVSETEKSINLLPSVIKINQGLPKI